MSTTYNTKVPMTIEQAIERTNWTKHISRHNGVTMLTDGSNYIEWWDFEHDGKHYLGFERWGANDVTAFEDAMGDVLLSEHDDGFMELPWNGYMDDEEEEF